MDRFLMIFSVLCFGWFIYLYGVASTKWQLFPYDFVHQAYLGAKALGEASFDDEPVPGIVTFKEAGASGAHPAAPGLGSAQDLILLTGGAGVLMDHCPQLGCLAWIMDRDGMVYHAWPIDPDEPWGHTMQLSGFTQIENFYPSSLHLYDNGDLLASYHGRNTYPYGVGLAMFDKDGKLLWKNELFTHHKLDVDSEGRIYTPGIRTIDTPFQIGDTKEQLVCEGLKIYSDFVYIIDRDGTIIDEISMLDSLISSGFSGLVYSTTDPCDPTHINDSRVLSVEDAQQYPDLAAGDLLISMRNINTVAVIDPSTKRVKWLVTGATIRQHSPKFIGNNEILVLDNLGGNADQGGTRLVEINMGSYASETVFPAADTPDLDFFTEIAGYFDLDAERDRALVALTMQGRIVEVDLNTYEVLWEYENLQDIDQYLKAKNETPTEGMAVLGMSAAYYVGRPPFLAADAPQPQERKAASSAAKPDPVRSN